MAGQLVTQQHLAVADAFLRVLDLALQAVLLGLQLAHLLLGRRLRLVGVLLLLLGEHREREEQQRASDETDCHGSGQ